MGTVTVPLAYLTYKFIEKPFRNPKFFIYQSIGRFIKKIHFLSKIHNIIILLLIAIFMILIYFSFNYLSKVDRGISSNTGIFPELCRFDVVKDKNSCKFYSKNNTIDFIYMGNSMTNNTSRLAKGIFENYGLGYYYMFLIYN